MEFISRVLGWFLCATVFRLKESDARRIASLFLYRRPRVHVPEFRSGTK